jgi:GNAT superfamily N-acetyltransferase
MFEETSIRFATVSDARGIAEVHVAAWKTTYQSIFPASVLEALSIEKRETGWREILSRTQTDFTLVGCDPEGQVVGFASGGAETTGGLGCNGELKAIYLLATVRRQGLGTLLMRRIARELQSRGFSSMAVWVLALNPYRRFYEARGGAEIAQRSIERGGQPFVEIAYGWRDLGRLSGQP